MMRINSNSSTNALGRGILPIVAVAGLTGSAAAQATVNGGTAQPAEQPDRAAVIEQTDAEQSDAVRTGAGVDEQPAAGEERRSEIADHEAYERGLSDGRAASRFGENYDYSFVQQHSVQPQYADGYFQGYYADTGDAGPRDLEPEATADAEAQREDRQLQTTERATADDEASPDGAGEGDLVFRNLYVRPVRANRVAAD